MRIQLFQPQAIYEMGGRANQEDCIYPQKGKATDENRVFVVCDGMGGMDKGEVASAAVCGALSKVCENLYKEDRPFTDDMFRQAVQQAYDALDAADEKHEGSMGTTMTFICFHAGGCLVAHIGDSRIYHLRPSMGYPEGVRFRSRDHSLVQQLYDLGELSYYGMATSPRKNIILKAMQPHQDQRTKPTFAHITDVKPGDYFYLCTDGMLEQMDDDELLSIVGNADKTDEEKVAQLIELTKNNADNHSAYLLKVKDVELDPVADNSLLSDENELRAKNKALNDTRKGEAWSEETAQPEAPVQKDSVAASQPAPQRLSAPESRKKNLLPYGIMAALAVMMFLVGTALGVWLFFFKGKTQPEVTDSTLQDTVKTVPAVAVSTDTVSTDSIPRDTLNRVKGTEAADTVNRIKGAETKDTPGQQEVPTETIKPGDL
jgi:protein phosphatase